MMSVTEIERIRRAIDAAFPETLAFLRELVQAKSVLGREEPAQELVERRLTELGFAVRSIEPDDKVLAKHQRSGIPLLSYAGRRCVVGTLEGEGKALLALNGHVDVVSEEPTEHWTRPPFDPLIEDGRRLYGRGAGDMKGGIAAMLLAVEAARALGSLRSTVMYQSVIEEECTGNGTLALCLEGPRPDSTLVGEPTGGAIWLAAPGIIWARIAIHAAAGHAGSSDERSNPIDIAFEIIASLRNLEKELNGNPESEFSDFDRPYLLNIGSLHSGDWPATSPGKAEIDVRLGFPISVEPVDAQELLEKAVHRVAPDAQVGFRGFRAHGYSLSKVNPTAALLADCHREVRGVDAPMESVRATSDLRYFAPPLGSGSAAMYGPSCGGAHAADEWVDLESIKDAASVLALFLRRFPS